MAVLTEYDPVTIRKFRAAGKISGILLGELFSRLVLG